MGWRPVQRRWVLSQTVPINTDWFAKDIVGDPNKSILMNVAFALDGAQSRVNVLISLDGVQRSFQLSDGQVIGADDFFSAVFIVAPNESFNLQHTIGDINVAALIHKEVYP